MAIFDDGGNARSRTWIIIASGLRGDVLAASIKEVAAKQHRGKWSEVPPKVETRSQDGRLYAFGEGGDLQLLVAAMDTVLWNLCRTSEDAHAA